MTTHALMELADRLAALPKISESGRNDDGIEGVAIPGVDCYDFDDLMEQAATQLRTAAAEGGLCRACNPTEADIQEFANEEAMASEGFTPRAGFVSVYDRNPCTCKPVEHQYRMPKADDNEWHRCTREEYEATIATGHALGRKTWTCDVEVRKLYLHPPADSGAGRDGWISVEDRLPERTGLGEVLVFDATHPGKRPWIETIHPSWWGTFNEACGEWMPTVTHWRDVPLPPNTAIAGAAGETK